MLEAFCIFEGGGAKGLAHVGALKVAETRKVKFVGVAGTSAGAIVAALVAAGFRADELFDPDRPGAGLLDIDFTQFFDRRAWIATTLFRAFLKETGLFHRLFRLLVFLLQLDSCVVWRLYRKRGVTTTTRFVEFLDGLLKKRVTSGSGLDGRVLCKDLPLLAIVASEIDNQRIAIFSKQTTPEDPVAIAVASSISIPFFFAPSMVANRELIDGGVLSNFPAWIFDRERQLRGPILPTYGFRLVERVSNPMPARSFSGFFFRVLGMLVSGDPLLETREIENLHIVPLQVRCSTLDFDLDGQGRTNLYRDGERGAEAFFTTSIGTQDPTEMARILRRFQEQMIGVLKREMGTEAPDSFHLRVNIVMPTTRGTLRVMYAYGMDRDADDRLEFNIGQGASSKCYQEKFPVLCDLEAAKQNYETDWMMNKYQQALVRPRLKSLLSVPIFPQTSAGENYRQSSAKVVGVLNFDSDHDLLPFFGRPAVFKEAATASALASKALSDRPLHLRKGLTK